MTGGLLIVPPNAINSAKAAVVRFIMPLVRPARSDMRPARRSFIGAN
jgi:hypothetical protein